MIAPLGTIELRPSSELMLMLDAIYRATDRLASAIEASNRIAGPIAARQTDTANTEVEKNATPTPVSETKAPRKPLSPERLEQLRQLAAKGRETKAAKRAASSLAADLSGLSALGIVVERKAALGELVAPTPAPKPIPAPQPKNRLDALLAVSNAISQKAPIDPGEPVFAGFEAVRKWAGERGLPFANWDDLPPVNAKRERLGLPRFKREFPRKGAFA